MDLLLNGVCCWQGLTQATGMVAGSANLAYPGEFVGSTVSALEQCVVEQTYVRGGMTRTLLYAQVRRHCHLRNQGVLKRYQPTCMQAL